MRAPSQGACHDAREQRGLEIAARFKLIRRERDWSVPSQTGEGRYTVSGLLPCHNSVLNALENPDLAPILRALIAESSRPLKAVECDFAVDSSGFTTCRFESWFDHKYGTTVPDKDRGGVQPPPPISR